MFNFSNYYIALHHKTGSNYICNPPVTDTDIDYICFTSDIEKADVALVRDGWSVDGGHYPDGDFNSYRKDQYNIILTDDMDFYNRFIVATKVAKKLNVRNKNHRITLFEAIIHNDFNEEEYETVELPVGTLQASGTTSILWYTSPNILGMSSHVTSQEAQ